MMNLLLQDLPSGIHDLSRTIDHVQGSVLANTCEIEDLEERVEALESHFHVFIRQTRLLMGALIQNKSPEVIEKLLRDGAMSEPSSFSSSESS